MGRGKEIVIRDQREVDAENILLKYGIDPDKRVSDNMITTSNPSRDNWFKEMYMNNEIKDSVLDCNSMCEHRKDCCHPWCACGINERGEVSKRTYCD